MALVENPIENSVTMASIAQLAEALVACPEEQFLPWVQTNRDALSFAFLQHFKDTYISASTILEDPIKTDRFTRYALTIAGVIAFYDPLALALAQWMRGLWAMYNAISEAAIWFRAALPAYEANNDALSVARLLSNLVGVLATIGETAEAEACYHKARPLFVEYAAQDPKFLVYHEQNFGWLLHSWGRHEEALMVHQRALILAKEYNLLISVAEIEINLCATLARLGRLHEIEEMLQRDRIIALAAGEGVTVARIDMNLGELYSVQGRPVEALRCFQQAANGFVPMEQGLVLARQATLLRQLGALSAALQHYDLALKSLEQYKLKLFYAETLINQATCLRLLGSNKALRRANKILDQAYELWHELGNSFRLAQISLERVLIALAQNQIDEALRLLSTFPTIPHNSSVQAEYQFLWAETHRLAIPRLREPQMIVQDYEAALTYATEHKLYWLQRSALRSMGKLFLTTDWAKARHFLEEATLVDDQLRQLLTVQELKASFHEEANNLYDDLIHHAYLQQESERVLLYAWRAKASAFLDLAHQIQDTTTYTPTQQQEINLLRQQIAALRWSLAKEAAAGGMRDGYEKNNPELAKLTEQLLAVKRQSHQKQWSSAGLTIDQLHAVLAGLEADLLLEYVRCDDKVYGICANRTGVQRVEQLADAETLAELAGSLALTFYSFNKLSADERSLVIDQRIAECHLLLQRCYDLLVMPFADLLQPLPTHSKLLIAPCDLISMLPFAAFWTGSNYWITQYELHFAQSGATLLLPLPTATSYSPAVVIAASTEMIQGVGAEATAVAQQFKPSVTFIDTPALHYLDSLQEPPRILHIAAHTIQRGDAPFFSGIQLQGEVLSVEHCFDLALWGCELVALSGCSTAAGMESDASLFAFQSACLLAGAKNILCSLWPIADGMPKVMMEHFYQRFTAGLPASTALRQTQLHFLQDRVYRHPALWAAFTCIGR